VELRLGAAEEGLDPVAEVLGGHAVGDPVALQLQVLGHVVLDALPDEDLGHAHVVRRLRRQLLGLGDRFLGHTERCRVLLHLIDGTVEDAGEAYKTVRAELEAYGHGLMDKPEIVALSKSDAMTKDAIKAQVAKLKKACKKTPLVLSAQSHEGVQDALRALLKIIDRARDDSDTTTTKEAAWQP